MSPSSISLQLGVGKGRRRKGEELIEQVKFGCTEGSFPTKLPGVGSLHFVSLPELYVAHRPVMPSGEAAMAGMLAAP